ncbi:unnamed protein product [Alopecurus aequalis]
MAMTMLTIYLHYEDVKQDVKILQRSMMRRYVSYYDLISMIEEVGFKAIDYLYYERKDPHDLYLVHIDGDSDVIKMLSDLENEKIVHMHVSKEKASDMYVFKEKASDDIAPPNSRNDISPSNHPNESVLLQDDGGSAVVEEQLIVKRPQRQVRRSKRLNMIQITDQRDEEDGDLNNGEQDITQGDESQALEDEDDGVHNRAHTEVVKRKRTSLPIVWNMPQGQRILVKCNEENQPIGEEGAILGKFLGTVARNGGFCPLDINDWRNVKKNHGEETILQCVKTKFVYPASCEKWILKSTGRDWRKFKSSLKKTLFNPAIKKNPDIRKKALYKLCPDDVDKDQWRGLIKFWKSKKGRAITEKNIISRSLVKNSHNAGTKSYARWSEDIRQADPEKKRPHRAVVYLATHKKKDTAESKDRNERLAQLEVLITQRPEMAQTVNGRVAWEGDALQEVLGEEKTGQVHGMGLLPTSKQVYGRRPKYLKNINMTTNDRSPCEGEDGVWEELAKLKEHIRRQDMIIKDMKNKEDYGDIGIEEEENRQSNGNVVSKLPIVHGKRKRVQCYEPDEARSSMQHDIHAEDDLLLSREKDGEHDNVNQLPIQQNLSSPQDLVIDSVSEVRKTRDESGETFSRQDQRTRIDPLSARTKRRRTSPLKIQKKNN